MRLLKKQDGRVEEFNPELWCGLLNFVTVGEKMVFTFRDGTEAGLYWKKLAFKENKKDGRVISVVLHLFCSV
ncbi:MAG: hypothetical protein IKP72_03650 [Clostridia bacterium]|nr:hypothetical protein [Clostridia bacterium]